MATAKRRLTVMGLVIVGSLVALGGAAGAPKTFPYIAGTWDVTAMECPGTCGDTWVLSPVRPKESSPYVYNMKDPKGFYAKNISISSNGSAAAFKETCDGCTGWEILTLTFKSPANGSNTFSGTWSPYSPSGVRGGVGTIKGVQVTPQLPAPGTGTAGWGPSKCARAYDAWLRQHATATSSQKTAETKQLDAAHGCDLSG